MPRLLGKSETIHKTVRLTQAQIDLIESQGQETFTANLDHLLNEVLLGESDRVRRMQEQQKRIRQSSEELYRLLRYIQASRVYCSGLETAMEKAFKLEDLLSEDGTASLKPRPVLRL